MHALLGIIVEPNPAPRLAIDEGHLLAAAQIRNCFCPLGGRDPVGDPPAISAAIEAENEPRSCRSSAMHKRIDAESAMSADKPCVSALKKHKSGPPHQRAVGEDPHVLVASVQAFIHGEEKQSIAG